jgi:hypothetical protein
MPKTIDFILAVARKILSMRGKGIASIANRSDVESKAGEIAETFRLSGLTPDKWDEFIKSENDVVKYLNIIEGSTKTKVKQSIQPKPLMKSQNPAAVFDLKGNRIKNTDNIMGGKEIQGTPQEKINWLVKNVDPNAEQTIPPKATLEAMLKDGREDLIDHFFEMHTKELGKPKINIDTSGLKHPELVKKMMMDKKLKPNLVEKLDPALYEDRGGNIIPAQFGIHPNSEIAKSLRLEAEAAKKLKNMSEAEIKLRGNRPYDTDEQIIARIEKQNKEAAERLKNKKKKLDEPDDMATGGRAGLYQGGQAQIEPDLSGIGHGSDALMARNMLIAPGSQATTSTGLNYLLGEDNDTTRVPYKEKGSVTLADLIKVNASGSKSGKNQIMGAPDGITADTETFNAIIKMDIPIMEKINLLGSYGYGKDRFKVEKGNKELFLGEGGYKDRNIGLGVNQGGEGLSGSVIRNLETGDNDYQLKFLKSFAEGGRIGYNEGNMVLPKPKAMDEYLLQQVMSQAGANTLDVRTREMFIEQLKKKIRDKKATEEKRYQFEELRDQGAEDMYYNNREKELDIKYNPQNYPPSMRKFAGGGLAGLLGEGPGSTDREPRTMYAEGQLVQNTVDGSRPGYSGKKAQLVQEVIQLIKNLNKTAKLKGLEEKLIKKYKSEGVGFIEAIKKAQTEAGGVRYEGRMKIIDDAMKEANVHSDDYVDLLDMKIKIEDPDFAKQYVNFPENLKNKTRSRHDPDWAEANFGKEYGTKLDQARSREINQSIDPNFKEPLSQSDQMVSNIDDMNIANTDEFFGRKKNAEGGRIGYEEAGAVDKIGGMVNYKNVPYYVNSAAKGVTDMAEWVSRLPFATTKLASDIIRKPLFKPGDRVPGLPGVGAKFVGGEMFNEFINNMTTGSWVDKLGLSSLVEEGGKKVSPEARTVGDIAESLGEFANVGGIFAAGKNLFKGGDSLKKLSQSMGKVKDNKTLEKLVDETLTARGEGRRDFNKLVASGGLMVALQSIGLGGIKAAKTKAAPDAVLTLRTIIDDSDVMTENGLQAIGREGSLIDVSGLTDAVKKSLAVIMKNRKNTFGNKVVRNKVKGKDGKFTEDYEDIPTEEAAYIMEELQKRGHNVKLEHYDDMGGQGVDDLLNKFKNKDKTYGKDNYDKFSKKVAKMTDKEKFAYHSSITDDSGNYYDEFVEELLDMNFKNSTK